MHSLFAFLLLAAVVALAISHLASVVAALTKQDYLDQLRAIATPSASSMGCATVAFETDKYRPGQDQVPTYHIEYLLDRLIQQTPIRCIATYSVGTGNDKVVAAAKARGLKVILGVWLDPAYPDANQEQINKGISLAKNYPDTVIAISCGHELGNSNDLSVATPVLQNCVNWFRSSSGVVQPIGTRDNWLALCNKIPSPYYCRIWPAVHDLDWLGMNSNTFVESLSAGVAGCIPSSVETSLVVQRFDFLNQTYSNKLLMVSQLGWPSAGDWKQPLTKVAPCLAGTVSQATQESVLRESLNTFRARGIPNILYQTYSDGLWKIEIDGTLGTQWGLCSNAYPYTCRICNPTLSRLCTFPFIGLPQGYTVPKAAVYPVQGTDNLNQDGRANTASGISSGAVTLVLSLALLAVTAITLITRR